MRFAVVACLAAGCLSRPGAIPGDAAMTMSMPDGLGSVDGSTTSAGAQLVQSVALTFSGGTMASVTLPHPPALGDSLIAVATFTFTQPFEVSWSDARGQTWVPVEASNCGSTALALGYTTVSTTDQTDVISIQTSTNDPILGLGVYEFSGLSDSVGSALQCPNPTVGVVSTPSLHVFQPALLFAAYADSMSVMPYTIDKPFVMVDVNASTYTYAAGFDNGNNMGVPAGDYASATSTANSTTSWIAIIAAFAVR